MNLRKCGLIGIAAAAAIATVSFAAQGQDGAAMESPAQTVKPVARAPATANAPVPNRTPSQQPNANPAFNGGVGFALDGGLGAGVALDGGTNAGGALDGGGNAGVALDGGAASVAGTPGVALHSGVEVVSPQTRATTSAQTQMTPAAPQPGPAQGQPGGGTAQLPPVPGAWIAVFPGQAPAADPSNGLNVTAGPQVGPGPQVGAGPNVTEGPQVGATGSDAGVR